jgi:hypothetical protein
MTKGLELDRARLVPLICERLALGEPLAVICRSMSIGRSTVNLWRREDQSIAEQFDEARDDGYDAIAHRMRFTTRGLNEDGSERVGMKDSQTRVLRDKLIVETDDKLLAKWDPRRYGNKLVTENTNTNFNTEVVDADEMDRRLDRAIAAALAANGAVEPDPAGA